MKRGQAAMEYLLLVGLTMMLIVPSVYLYSERQKSYQLEFISAQVNQIGNTLIDNVRTIQSLGRGSKSIFEFNFPSGINNLTVVGGRELVFNVRAEAGSSELIYVCQFCKASGPTINGTFTQNDVLPGRKTFRIIACENFIAIERVARNQTGEFEPTGASYNC